MKGIFWNVRGIRQDTKKNFIREAIIEKNLDFVGLLETIKGDFTKNELHNLAGGNFFSLGMDCPSRQIWRNIGKN